MTKEEYLKKMICRCCGKPLNCTTLNRKYHLECCEEMVRKRLINRKAVLEGATAITCVRCGQTYKVDVTEKTKDGKKIYSAEYKVEMPKDAALGSSAPSALKAISVAIAPAVDEVLADISPYKTTKEFEANHDGDEKVVMLMEAKAFSAAIEVVDALKEKTFADYENQGLAYEASGDFNSAKASYKEALKLKADAQGALDGIKRIDEVKAAAKKVNKSGAKKDSSTSFKK